MQRYFSDIYWHFTGAPRINWHEATKPSDIRKLGEPKPISDAVDIATKILESRSLWATCTERVLPGIITDKFCCTTDIPLKDLLTHAQYYGPVAVGFKASAIHPVFNPVLYIPTANLPMIAQITELTALGRQAFELFGPYQGAFAEQQMRRMLAHPGAKQTRGWEPPTGSKEPLPKYATSEPNERAVRVFANYLKVTQFAADGDSFYREREWRHIGDFAFKAEDIAAVVVPKDYLGVIKKELHRLAYPDDVSVISFEFLEQV